MAYEHRSPGNRLGIHAAKTEKRRQELGLTPSGFREDKTDPLEGDREEMLKALYRRENAKLPSGIGAARPL